MKTGVYYNEFDPFAAGWLRSLIKARLIPEGDVDERSIVDVRGDDLRGYRQHHFFAGIGGWSHALDLAGWDPEEPVWTGSCPCQPFSVAGKGLGESDPRHLWPHFARLIAECRPPVVFGEQVASAAGRLWLSGVRADLEDMAYAVGAADLCAAGVGAPHIRQRLYWVADASGERRQQVGRSAPGDEEAHGRTGRDSLKPDGANVSSGGGADSGLADASFRGLGADGWSPGKAGYADERREDGRLAVTDLSDAEAFGPGGARKATSLQGVYRSPVGRPGEPGGAGRTGDLGLGEPVVQGLEGYAGDGDLWDEPGWDDEDETGSASPAGCSGLGFWADVTTIQCRDGKHRRIPLESSLFPLAHGVPGRVGKLRGYGNAIVPPLAAEFISAYLDITGGNR